MAERTFYVNLPPELMGPAVRQAMVDAGQIIIAAWREAAADHVATGDYLARLTMAEALRYPYMSDLNAVAVVNTAKYAYWLEEGRAGFHLAAHWSKWKVSKKGTLYARVPFRIDTPIAKGGGVSTTRMRQAMPQAVYSWSMHRNRFPWNKPAVELGLRERQFGHGERYKASKSYHYFRQLFEMPPTLAGVEGYTWKASKYENMFRVGPARTPGGGTQGEYMTIRTITPESKGWLIPPSPGHHFAERALAQAAPAIDQLIQQAAAQELANAIQGALT